MFVPGAIIGEKVCGKIIKSNKDYSVARVEHYISKSKHRVEPICSVYKCCGGCSCMHVDYNMQLIQKKRIVENLLTKSGIDSNILKPTVGMGVPYYYRNKVQYPVRVDKSGKNVLGFYQKRSHDIVQNDCCYIQDRVIDILAKNIFDILTRLNFKGYDEIKNVGDIRHIMIRRGYHTGEIMVVIVANHRKILKDKRIDDVVKQIKSLSENIVSIFINVNDKNTNEILGEVDYNLYGSEYITDCIGRYKYYISPKSFFQVNTVQAEMLYSILRDELNLNKDDVIFDLYSGVGSIGIFLSDKASKIYGIEIEPQAVKMANMNVAINNVENAEYIAGSVEEKIEEFKKRNIKPDAIVVDPPRKGLDEKSIEYILDFNAKKIGYVSCNPATLVRDLKLLLKKYDIKSITPVDMFPQTRTC